ncbi:MAG: hypothetical protein GY765_40165, partial [bacterium]|nr:hypothetical protein [bacterium]
MRKNTRWGLFLFCFIYWCISITHLSALDPAKRLSQYQLDVWNVERGFPDDLVNSVVQTKDGYIWLGTRDGLVRFDGSRFTVFNIDNTPELEDNVIRYLYEDPQGTLWIGTPNGGLSFLKNGAFKTFPASEYPALNGISCIISGDKGETWISTFKNGISRVEKGNFESFNTGSGLPSDAVYTLETDIDGNLWMGTPKGLCKRTPPGDFVTYTKENGMQSDFVFSLQAQKDGGLWIGGYNCLSFFDGKTFTHFDTSETISNPTIISLYLDSSQTLWLGTDGGGLARFKNGVFEVFGTEQGLGSGFIYSFMEDREGSMWLGTLDGGLLRLRDTKFTNFTVREGLTRDYVNCVYQDRAGTIWVGTELGADCFKNGTWSRGFPVSTVPAKSAVTSIVEDEKGYMWFGSGTGLHRTGKSGTVSYTKARGLPDDYVVSLTVDGAGDIWVGTQKGPACFSNGRFYTAVGNEAPAASVVSSILEDRFGTIWVGTTTGLYRLRKTLPEKNKPWDAQQVTGFPDNYIEAIVEDAEGVIFVGTHGGVSRMERGRWTHFNGRSGLVHDSVNCILEDANENLWLAGRQGIAWVAKKELSEFSQGKIEKIHPVFYNEQDGMKTRWCKRSGWKSRDGKLWFAGNKGVTMIHPGRIRRNTLHPPVVIEELLVDGLPVDISGKNGAKTVKLLPPGTVRLEFFYTALSFLNPRKVQFKLQLEGHDPDWIDVGNARSTIYTNLSPGEYTFRVMARNSDGTWNRTGASLELYKKPYF